MAERRTQVRSPRVFKPSAKTRPTPSRNLALQQKLQTEHTGTDSARFIAKAVEDIGIAFGAVAKGQSDLNKIADNQAKIEYEEILDKTLELELSKRGDAVSKGLKLDTESFKEHASLTIDKVGSALTQREDFRSGVWNDLVDTKREGILLGAEKEDVFLNETTRIQTNKSNLQIVKERADKIIRENPTEMFSDSVVDRLSKDLTTLIGATFSGTDRGEMLANVSNLLSTYVDGGINALENNQLEAVRNNQTKLDKTQFLELLRRHKTTFGYELLSFLNAPGIAAYLGDQQDNLEQKANLLIAGGEPDRNNKLASQAVNYADHNIEVSVSNMASRVKAMDGNLLIGGNDTIGTKNLEDITTLKGLVEKGSKEWNSLNLQERTVRSYIAVDESLHAMVKHPDGDVGAWLTDAIGVVRESQQPDADLQLKSIGVAYAKVASMITKEFKEDSFSALQKLYTSKHEATGTLRVPDHSEIMFKQLQLIKERPDILTEDLATWLPPSKRGILSSILGEIYTTQDPTVIVENRQRIKAILVEEHGSLINKAGANENQANDIVQAIRIEMVKPFAEKNPQAGIVFDLADTVADSFSAEERLVADEEFVKMISYMNPNNSVVNDFMANPENADLVKEIREEVATHPVIQRMIAMRASGPNPLIIDGQSSVSVLSDAISRYAYGKIQEKAPGYEPGFTWRILSGFLNDSYDIAERAASDTIGRAYKIVQNPTESLGFGAFGAGEELIIRGNGRDDMIGNTLVNQPGLQAQQESSIRYEGSLEVSGGFIQSTSPNSLGNLLLMAQYGDGISVTKEAMASASNIMNYSVRDSKGSLRSGPDLMIGLQDKNIHFRPGTGFENYKIHITDGLGSSPLLYKGNPVILNADQVGFFERNSEAVHDYMGNVGDLSDPALGVSKKNISN